MNFKAFTDTDLHAELPRLAGNQRAAIAEFVAGLAEFESRRLHLELGFTSIYSYCAQKLHIAEGAAYRRIEAARVSRKFPVVLVMLRDGRLSLATAAMLASKLTAANAEQLLTAVSFKSKREVELLLATMNPKPPVPCVVRKLPEPRASASTVEDPPMSLSELVAAPMTPASRRPVVAPLSEAHYKLQVTISAASREKLREIQALMRHRLPSGDPAAIVEHALEVLHAELLKQKAAQVAKPRKGTATEAAGRYIPAPVRREVWRRDQGRCAFTAADGRRCGSPDGVEFHHVQPYATGGVASARNIEMRCRAHNGFEWERHLTAETEALLHR